MCYDYPLRIHSQCYLARKWCSSSEFMDKLPHEHNKSGYTLVITLVQDLWINSHMNTLSLGNPQLVWDTFSLRLFFVIYLASVIYAVFSLLVTRENTNSLSII